MRRLFYQVYSDFDGRGYFRQSFGHYCNDNQEFYAGPVGDQGLYFTLSLRREGLFPVSTNHTLYSEDDLFDVIELHYDHVAKPVGEARHSWCSHGGCPSGEDDVEAGKMEFRAAVNEILGDYEGGYELTAGGEIARLGEHGMEGLLEAPIRYDPSNVDDIVKEAISRFRGRHSSAADRHHAVRSLADVLEFLRPRMAGIVLRQDESALFDIANNFAIRHHNQKQKRDYDSQVWLS